GYNHDRKFTLQVLSVSVAEKDIHAVFAGLSLMTYHEVVLLLSGYQADEACMIEQYRVIVDNVSERYPTGSFWILNHILRMSGDAEGAIKVLQDGLLPDRPHLFVQANALSIFELAWMLLSQRRITEMNNWLVFPPITSSVTSTINTAFPLIAGVMQRCMSAAG
ncbi:hypothetical protein JAAARDRAFT_135215, partial [Jaapia argillacea MUCL 33604]